MQDGEIIRASLDEPEAFAEIFDRHFDRVLSYARRRVGWTAGEEVASQTFVIAFEGRAHFDPSSTSAGPWLLGIATNVIRHHLRHERMQLEALRRAPPEGDEPSVEDLERLDAIRLRPAIAEALIGLSDLDREAFLLLVLGDLTSEEAARALGVPSGTVRSRVHRARHALRERFEGLAAIHDRDRDEDDETP